MSDHPTTRNEAPPAPGRVVQFVVRIFPSRGEIQCHWCTSTLGRYDSNASLEERERQFQQAMAAAMEHARTCSSLPLGERASNV